MRKAIIILLVVLILLLNLPAIVLAAKQPNKPITPNELKNITFIHYAKPDRPPGKPVPDDPLPPPEPINDYYKLLKLYLPDEVSYGINPAGAPGSSFDIIATSFETWDNVTDEPLFNDNPKLTSLFGLRYDEVNNISWAKISGRRTIAVTSLWYIDDNNPETFDAIIEFDMVFNSRLAWGIDSDTAYDVQNIATHEVGHVIGLADLYEDQYRELTMYGYGSIGETLKSTLEEGDRLGAQFICASTP
ncbi:MAG: hypothetical protein PHQ86_05615 [Dehalococcoidales bacterium]|nr:hypothetical protein [Dehalococcoidales bacterium]